MWPHCLNGKWKFRHHLPTLHVLLWLYRQKRHFSKGLVLCSTENIFLVQGWNEVSKWFPFCVNYPLKFAFKVLPSVADVMHKIVKLICNESAGWKVQMGRVTHFVPFLMSSRFKAFFMMTMHFLVDVILEYVKPHQSEDTEIITLILSIIKGGSDCKWQISSGSSISITTSESVSFHYMVLNNNHPMYAEIKYKW